jgi:hypothetical protein
MRNFLFAKIFPISIHSHVGSKAHPFPLPLKMKILLTYLNFLVDERKYVV